jgi:hypothetical protein
MVSWRKYKGREIPNKQIPNSKAPLEFGIFFILTFIFYSLSIRFTKAGISLAENFSSSYTAAM